MLQDVFYWVFNMSITAAVTGALVMLIRCIKKIPRRITIILWIIPFLRMTVPFGWNSPYSLMALLSRFTTKTIVVYQPAEGFALSITNCVMAADSYFPITYKVNVLEEIFAVASVIWIVVSAALLVLLSIAYFTTLRDIKGCTPWKEAVYLSEKITSPAVYGIIRPKIVLPVSYKDNDIDYILLHEHVHIRRLDNLWRLLAWITAAIHWFNPFCWIFLKAFLTDLELSCDEHVVAKLGADRAKDYALSLLESKQRSDIFASAFGGAAMRTRIEHILSFRKLTRLSLILFILMISAVCYVLLTNAG